MRIAPASACSYPLRRGNLVRPLVDGIPAFRAILAAVAAAKQSVWLTVAFVDDDLEFPDGHGSFFDVLERAARRGLDVRVLFWSEPEIERLVAGSAHFPAGPASYEVLAERAPHVLARWDRLEGYCHHQKSWIMDAGTDDEVAFVGGINLDHDSIVSPGHPHGEGRTGGTIHDVYALLRGPSASDVHHNFVQRWNEASERLGRHGAFPLLAAAGDLAFPLRASREAGDSLVQIARTVSAEAYACDVAAPGAQPFAIRDGETSIVDQYLAAVDGAERTIYLENQIVLCPFLLERLDAALGRGVDVTMVVPAQAMPALCRHRRHPMLVPTFQMLESLSRHERFLMAALGRTREDGSHTDIYVHSKVAIVDDEWTTIGSANAMFRSFRNDTEMNVTTWDRSVAHSLRVELFQEHLANGHEPETAGHACPGGDATHHEAAGRNGSARGHRPAGAREDDREAMRVLRDRALENAARRREGRPMRGSIFAIDPARWALPED